ncbi:MAG: insulinase family protein [Saprospiraceae bacterium]|nr:insulinase family protein [Saprospiraceae bacterium]
MNRLYYLILPSLLILFSYCSPKTGTKTTETETKPMSQDNAFRATPPTPGPAPKIQMGRYIKFEMPNGLQVIVVENSKLPVVSMQLFVDVPPILQGEFAGYTDFAGELLNKGTKKRSKQQLDEAIDFMGARLSTSANGVFGTSLKKHTDSLAMLMSEILLQPAFPVEEFDKLKTRTLSGLAASKDNPSAIAGNVSNVLRYGKKHPYGEITTEETVAKITLDKSKEYYNTYFRPNISYLVVVGDMNVIQARNLATKYFGAWEKKGCTCCRKSLSKFCNCPYSGFCT